MLFPSSTGRCTTRSPPPFTPRSSVSAPTLLGGAAIPPPAFAPRRTKPPSEREYCLCSVVQRNSNNPHPVGSFPWLAPDQPKHNPPSWSMSFMQRYWPDQTPFKNTNIQGTKQPEQKTKPLPSKPHHIINCHILGNLLEGSKRFSSVVNRHLLGNLLKPGDRARQMISLNHHLLGDGLVSSAN